MKTFLLMSCFAFAMSTANAQNQQDLIQEDWYVSYLVIDGVTYDSPIVNGIGITNPNIEFFETQVYAVLDPESDSFFSDVTYDPIEPEFTFLNPAITLPGCYNYCDFAIVYFPFLFGDGEDVLFTYSIIIIDNPDPEYILIIEDEAGNIGVYQDEPILGVDDLSISNFTVYPNPVSSTLVVASEGETIDSYVIYNAMGQAVLSGTVSENSVEVSNLQQGIYFIKVTSEEGEAVRKFIKK